MGQRPERVARSGGTVSLSQFGLGFWQAWWTLALCSTTIIDDAAGRVAGVAPSVAVLALTTLGYLVVALAGARSPRRLSERPHLLAACAGACGLGSLGMALATAGVAGHGTGFSALFLASVAAFSLGNGLLLTMWGELWSTLATGKVGRCLCTSYLLAIALYLAVAHLPLVVRVGLLVALPAVSCAILRHAQGEPRRDASDTRPTTRIPHALIARALLAAFALNLVWGLGLPMLGTLESVSLDASQGTGALSFLVALLCVAGLLLYISMARPEVEAFSLYTPVGCALIGGIVLALAFPGQLAAPGSGLVIFGGACLDNLVMLVATDLAFLTRRPVALTLGVALLVGRTGSLAGRMASNATSSLSPEVPEAILLLCVLLVAVVGLAVFSAAHLHALYRGTDTLAMPATGGLDERCATLAAGHGLTTRETEVLGMLARGRSAPFIAGELSLAQGTVKNHISSIYRKVGVSDRQGLLNAIERTGEARGAMTA